MGNIGGNVGILVGAAVVLSGVSVQGTVVASDTKTDAAQAFFASLQKICGQRYLARVVDGNDSDEKWRAARIIVHTPACSDKKSDLIKMPLHVGADQSRTWMISKTETGLKLQHDHRHKDGTPDAVTLYGGDSNDQGTKTSQHFPADAYTKALFLKEGLAVSVDNVWTLSITKNKAGAKILSYRLSRPGRSFQLDADLSKPLK